MKKLRSTALTLILAFCFALGAVSLFGVNTAHADNVPGTMPTLSETKVRISKDNGKMLLVTAIKDCADVYEIGYEFTGESPTKEKEEKHVYYTSISDGVRTFTAEDLFGGEFSGAKMIIWEIVCKSSKAYTFNAYALVGDRTEGGELVETGRKKTGTVATKKFVAYPYEPVVIDYSAVINILYLDLSSDITVIKVNGMGINIYDDEVITFSGPTEITIFGGFPRGEDLEIIFETDNETVATKITII